MQSVVDPERPAATTLTGLLTAWAAGELRETSADAAILAALHDELELAASTYPLPPTSVPMRVTKGVLGDLVRCQQLAAARVVPRPGPWVADEPVSPEAARGRLVDVLAAARVLAGERCLLTFDRARGLLAADDPGSSAAVEAALDGLGARERAAMAVEVEASAVALTAGWGEFDGAWWPRTQERVAIRLGDASVICSARVDIVVGGHPTASAAVPVEVKSRPVREQDIADVHLYALLLALRDGRAPTVAVVCAPAATHAVLVTPATLTSAAVRLGRAVETLAMFAAGRTPERTPGWWCRSCPVRGGCPSAPDEDDPGEHDVDRRGRR